MTTVQERKVPVGDSWIDEANPTDTHGAAEELSIGVELGADPDEKHALIAFDLGHTSGTVTNAKLSVFVITTDAAPQVELRLARMISTFDESTVTWANSQPAQPHLPEIAWNIIPTGGVKTSIDISTLLQGAVDFDGGILYLRIRLRTSGSEIAITSKETVGAANLKATLRFDVTDSSGDGELSPHVVTIKTKPPSTVRAKIAKSKTKKKVKAPSHTKVDIETPNDVSTETDAPCDPKITTN